MCAPKKKILVTFASEKVLMFMRRFIFIIVASALFASCHESLEDKAEREAQEFTKKNCPVMVSPGITNDSITFDRNTLTLHYYYSLSGMIDTTAIDSKQAKEVLLKGVRDATSFKKYKENGFNFAYTYFSTKHKGQVLVETVITPKEYNAK